jgi:hypothetical protein
MTKAREKSLKSDLHRSYVDPTFIFAGCPILC